MVLQTASDLFRVRSSFDSGDLYEVFCELHVLLNATYSVGFLCPTREDLHKLCDLSFYTMACELSLSN